jgi:hypothetical protein
MACGVVEPSGGCLPFCTSCLSAFLDLRPLKSFSIEILVGMVSTKIDETHRDCGEVVDGYAESTRRVSQGNPDLNCMHAS